MTGLERPCIASVPFSGVIRVCDDVSGVLFVGSNAGVDENDGCNDNDGLGPISLNLEFSVADAVEGSWGDIVSDSRIASSGSRFLGVLNSV